MTEPRRRDVVFTFSYETWDDAVHRGMMRPPDRIVTSLLRSPRVDRLLVVNPYRSRLSRIAQRPSAPFPTTNRTSLVTPTRLRRRDPTSTVALERTYARYGAEVRRFARRRGLVDPVMITTHPLVAGFAGGDWPGEVLYFGRDDWASSPARRRFWPAYRAAYARIAADQVRVATVSQQILDRIGPTAASAVIPNGIDPAEWIGPLPAAPAWLHTLPRPIALYTGTIDSRLDVPGLVDLAHQIPHVTFVLLGPTSDIAHVAPVAGVRNIVVHSGVGRDELIAATRNVDVALVAHVRSPLTEAMSPLKAYEYIAAGLPVVSTDLPPMHLLSEFAAFAPSVSAFAPLVGAAIAAGRIDESRRLDFVERNSWSARHDALFDLVF
jgi:teichuronic acid biosynthesis glycosyltransferase TuaH